MNEIRDYLRLPASMRLYSKGMELFSKYALLMPQFAPYFATLSVGPLGNNIQLLEECLQGVVALGPAIPFKVSVVETKPPKPTLAVKSTQELDLLVKVRKLRQERAKTSQAFHGCQSDTERAHICDLIDQIDKEIKEVDGQLAYIQRHGALPPQESVEEKPLPETYEGLMKERNRLSSNIFKVEKRIEHLETLPPSMKRTRNLVNNHDKLRRLTSRKILVVAELKKIRAATKKLKTKKS